MKIHLSRYFMVVIASAAIITACNKGAVKQPAKPNTQTLMNQQLSRLAVNLYRSITGQYGGANPASGLKLSSAKFPAKGLKLSDQYASCGTTILTTSDSSYVSNDTSYVKGGNYLFTYVCDSSEFPNGYKNANQFYVKATDAKAQSLDSLNIIQDYSVKLTLDTAYGIFSFVASGQLTTTEHHAVFGEPPYTYFGTPETTYYVDYNSVYTLKDVFVQFFSNNNYQPATITKGSVTYTSNDIFTDIQNYPADTFASTGTITFLGNNLVTIDAYYPSVKLHYVHTVNVVTGQIIN